MSKRRDIGLLQDIRVCILQILEYTRGMDYEAFIQDRKTQDAVVRNLEIIGEAVKGLSVGLTSKYLEIPWSKMAKQRDRLIHQYAAVDYDIVWGIIESILPGLPSKIEAIINCKGN